MKTIATTTAALLATTSIAAAGGLDRSGQPVDALFETGTYAELSFGRIDPEQSGTLGGGALSSGDVTPAYSSLGAAIKWDLNPQMSVALIYDQPFGARINYSTAGYPLVGTTVDVHSDSVTALLRYRMDNGFSVHGGLRAVTARASMVQPSRSLDLEADRKTGLGYVIGAAYERPQIALRAALTYSTAIDMEHDAKLSGLLPTKVNYTLPQSVNLDFQTGIAAGTLLFANVRWADWSESTITMAQGGGTVLADFDDSIEYTIGIGRQITDRFAASVSYGWENGRGGPVSNTAPSDGYKALSLGASYDMTDNLKLSGGVTYQWRGDATTEIVGASFTDNTLMGAGIKISYTF